MRIYLAMWSRGIKGCDVTPEDMQANKLYAQGIAKQLRSLLEPYHEIVSPHEDTLLDRIDDLWLQTRDCRLVPMAMDRCFDLLKDCQGIILLHRGYVSEGMASEESYAEVKGMFIYKEHDLTDEVKEDLVLALNEFELASEQE